MAKIHASQLEIAKEWEAFGDRLGWKFDSVELGTKASEEYCLFQTADGSIEKITLKTRRALQAIKQDKPKLEVANG